MPPLQFFFLNSSFERSPMLVGVHCTEQIYCVPPHRQLEGQNAPEEWGVFNKLGSESDVITVEVNNVLSEKKINNVFGVIEGFVDAGAQNI